MKQLLKAAFTLITAALFTTTSAQTTGAFLKYDVNGKTVSVKSADLHCYNSFEQGEDYEKPSNVHVFYVTALSKQVYQLSIRIHTPPHTDPVVGKIPYVQTVYYPEVPCPGVHLTMTKVGAEYDMFNSVADNPGNFEITKVAAGWVEGKFDIEMPKIFAQEGDEVLHITNGSFRFKIAKESKD